MTTSTEDEATVRDRAKAERLYDLASRVEGGFNHEAEEDHAELYADVQLTVLQAIYHELRHGHDLHAAQAKALQDVAAELDRVATHLGGDR